MTLCLNKYNDLSFYEIFPNPLFPKPIDIFPQTFEINLIRVCNLDPKYLTPLCLTAEFSHKEHFVIERYE